MNKKLAIGQILLNQLKQINRNFTQNSSFLMQ